MRLLINITRILNIREKIFDWYKIQILRFTRFPNLNRTCLMCFENDNNIYLPNIIMKKNNIYGFFIDFKTNQNSWYLSIKIH